MKEKMFVTLDKKEIQEAIEDYLAKKGYQAKNITYSGAASLLGVTNVNLSSAEVEVKKIPLNKEL